MKVTLGDISFDDDIVLKRLKSDLRDDWFPDPLGFTDILDGSLLTELINKNFENNHGSYVPSKALLLNIPKGNFTLRYALESSVVDRTVYHALASYLVPFYDPLLSWRVFSHRRPQSTSTPNNRASSRYTFRNPISAWNDFLGCVRSALQPDHVLLSTDLANYFENITISRLKDDLIRYIPELSATADDKGHIRTHINRLFEYLPAWTFSIERGLPQNRDASSFLANIYMRTVDDTMISDGYEYFRYMDDIKIVCRDLHTARRALKRLVIALRPLGQAVNSGKTEIVPANSTTEIARCLDEGSPELRRINAAWQSKSLKVISRTFIPLKQLTLRTIQAPESKSYNSREFRFCVSRLEALARCEDFQVPASFFDEITPLIIAGLDTAPVATDQICKYLRSAPLDDHHLISILDHLLDDSKSIYNWKNYHIWLLLTQKHYITEPTLELARRIITDRKDDPTRAGATIYLGAFGTKSDRILIAERFESLETFLGQRSAVIGLQELHYSASPKNGGPSIKTHVQPYLRADLRGSYRALNRRGVYVSQMEPFSITRYVDLERDYDG